MTVNLKENNLRDVSVYGNQNNIISIVGSEEIREAPHDVLKVTMKDNTEYVVDIAGAQYGYHYPVCRWELFALGRIRRIDRVNDFGTAYKGLSDPRNNFVLVMMREPARDAIISNQGLVTENMDTVFDAWMEEKQSTVALLTKMGKKKHDGLMSEMFNTLAVSMQDFVGRASKNKNYVVAIKNTSASKEHPNGRSMYVYGDGSTKYYDELQNEVEEPEWAKLPSEEELRSVQRDFPFMRNMSKEAGLRMVREIRTMGGY